MAHVRPRSSSCHRPSRELQGISRAGLDRPEPRPPAQIDSLIELARHEPRDRAIRAVFWSTGLRTTELRSLTAGDLHGPLLFTTWHGRPFNRSGLYMLIRTYDRCCLRRVPPEGREGVRIHQRCA